MSAGLRTHTIDFYFMKLKMLSVLVLLGTTAWNAEAKRIKDPVTWVVETNVNSKNYSLIRFYDSNFQFRGDIRLEGVYLDINKAKDIRRIRRLSEQLEKIGRVH